MKTSGGYAGLIALLVTVAIIGFLTWSIYQKSAATAGISPVEGITAPTTIKQDFSAMQQAKDARAMLEVKNRALLSQ